MGNSLVVNVVMVIVVLHLIVGFGFLVVKLSGGSNEGEADDKAGTEE